MVIESWVIVHGWDSIENLSFNSLLGLSIHQNVKCYPTMTKGRWGDSPGLAPDSESPNSWR